MTEAKKAKRPRPRLAYEEAGEVRNKDPERKYVLCYRPAVERYLEIGWQIEKQTKDGPRLAGNTGKDGDAIEFSGHVLMSMSKEDHADLEQFGHINGGAPAGNGQEYADQIDKWIVTQTAAKDSFRAIGTTSGGKYFEVVNETSGETPINVNG